MDEWDIPEKEHDQTWEFFWQYIGKANMEKGKSIKETAYF